MIIHNAPETASSRTNDNLHDLLAEYPWLFNPEWQVFEEEKSISRQLREWGVEDCPEEIRSGRVDFLAFHRDSSALVVIEMKRPAHAVEYEEMQRLDGYQIKLMRAYGDCKKVLVYGGHVAFPEGRWTVMKDAADFEALTWDEMFARAKRFYSHYEAVLLGDVGAEGFQSKRVEVARTREIIERGSSHRSAEDRERGVGDSHA